MSNQHTEVPRDHRVSIRYDDGSHFFRLAPGTTLGELAVRIGGLDRLHDRSALMIEIAFETQHPCGATRAFDTPVTH